MKHLPWVLLALVLAYPLFAQGTLTKVSTFRGPIQVEGIPTPAQMMRVVGGTPFTVPAGKLFVATGVRRMANLPAPDSSNQQWWMEVKFNSQIVVVFNGRWQQGPNGAGGDGDDKNIQPGLTAPEGTLVETYGVLLGYLVDA